MITETVTDVTNSGEYSRACEFKQVEELVFQTHDMELPFLRVYRWLVEQGLDFDLRVVSIYYEDEEVGSAGIGDYYRVVFNNPNHAVLFKLRWM